MSRQIPTQSNTKYADAADSIIIYDTIYEDRGQLYDNYI